jgi:alcohol dehydrogenase class IV
MQFDAHVPTRLVFGAGRLAEAGALARSLGRRAIVVTSRTSAERLGYTRRLLDSLAEAGVTAAVFRDLGPSPTTDDADRAAEVARAAGADLVIGLGGGSALDCAKAVAGVATARLACAEFLHGRAHVGPDALPLLAIPTTAGTGSDMNRAAILTDTALRHKDALRSDYLFPRIALVDPTLTHDVPADVTAQTGFDALAHAVESYVSPKSQPLADALALDAVAAVVAALPVALAEPHNAAARARLSLAGTSMGYNLSCVGTCLPHRLDKPLCAFYPQLAHGQAVAFFYPSWAAYSWPGCPDRFARVTGLLDPTTTGWPTEQAAAACAGHLAAFIRGIGLGRPATSFGVAPGLEEVSLLAQRVRGDLRMNPVPVEIDRLTEFYRLALTGGSPEVSHVVS